MFFSDTIIIRTFLRLLVQITSNYHDAFYSWQNKQNLIFFGLSSGFYLNIKTNDRRTHVFPATPYRNRQSSIVMVEQILLRKKNLYFIYIISYILSQRARKWFHTHWLYDGVRMAQILQFQILFRAFPYSRIARDIYFFVDGRRIPDRKAHDKREVSLLWVWNDLWHCPKTRIRSFSHNTQL